MANSKYPAGAITKSNGGVFQVTDKDGELLSAFNMPWMIERLLVGEAVSKTERQTLGMALQHLMDLT